MGNRIHSQLALSNGLLNKFTTDVPVCPVGFNRLLAVVNGGFKARFSD